MRRDEFPIVHMAIKDAVVKTLKEIRAEIILMSDKADQESKVSNSYSVRDRLRTKAQTYDDVAKLIDGKIKEIKHLSMIEVIRSGKRYEINCACCGARLRFSKADEMHYGTSSFIICPECNNNVGTDCATEVTKNEEV